MELSIGKVVVASASAVVLGGLVAFAINPAVAGNSKSSIASSVSSPTATPSPEYGADGPSRSPQRLAAYRSAVAAFTMPLPEGYAFPVGGEATMESGHVIVLHHWIAAVADAGLRAQGIGDAAMADQYAATLSQAWADVIRPTFGTSADYMEDAIADQDFQLLLQAYPVPVGMRE